MPCGLPQTFGDDPFGIENEPIRPAPVCTLLSECHAWSALRTRFAALVEQSSHECDDEADTDDPEDEDEDDQRSKRTEPAALVPDRLAAGRQTEHERDPDERRDDIEPDLQVRVHRAAYGDHCTTSQTHGGGAGRIRDVAGPR